VDFKNSRKYMILSGQEMSGKTIPEGRGTVILLVTQFSGAVIALNILISQELHPFPLTG
jgi:hypothetical protein